MGANKKGCNPKLKNYSLKKSGRLDLNQRPLDPQSSALTVLRYAPILKCKYKRLAAKKPAIFIPFQ